MDLRCARRRAALLPPTRAPVGDGGPIWSFDRRASRERREGRDRGPEGCQKRQDRSKEGRRLGRVASWRSAPADLSHDSTDVRRGGLDQETLPHVLGSTEPHPAMRAGLVQVRHRALDHLPSLPLKRLALLPGDPGAVLVERRLLYRSVRAPLPAPLSAHLRRDGDYPQGVRGFYAVSGWSACGKSR